MIKVDNVSNLKNYETFRKTGLILLHRFLVELLNCEVNIEEQPIEIFSQYIEVDFTENIKKYAYISDENRVVLSVKVIEGDEIIALLPIYLVGKKIGCIAVNYLEQIGSAITIVLTQCYNQNFNGAERLFGEYLQDKVIYSCFAKHIYQTDRVSFLISYLKKLCLLTFENKEFTTGFILTRSIFDFNKEKFHARGGTIYNLKQPQDIFKFIKPDRRLWYLVDGETSFFLTNQQFKITNIYTISSEKDARNYWDSYSLSKILWGNDIVFRVVNHNQISIVNSDGIEFIAIENSWKFRDYKVIKAIVQENSNLDEDTIDCMIYYVLQCAKNNESSILWFPKDDSEEKLRSALIKCNSIVYGTIDIKEEKNIELVKRIISSDGVTIINAKGEIIYSGCVVNLNKSIESKKMIGTGESAARLLAENGLAIKVSQDGIIKMYYDIDKPPFIF